MRAGKTQLRGTSRGGDTANRRHGWIEKLRWTATQPRERAAKLITTIAVIIACIGGAGPAAADTLVTNLQYGAQTPSDNYKLSVKDVAQPFTTGPNTTGYRLESISIDFATGRARKHDPLYVYLHEDNGNGGVNHRNQVTTLSKNGFDFEGPLAGVNKYTVWERNRCCPKASTVHLEANTRYWVYIWAGEDATTTQLAHTGSAETGAAGWSVRWSRFFGPVVPSSRDSRAAVSRRLQGRACCHSPEHRRPSRPLTRFADPARSARARARGTSPAAASSARRARSQSPAQALTRRRNASSVAQRRARSSTAT